jgi:uncharacterized protein
MQSENKPIRVLSIDGGGIRGLIPALVLAEFERCSGKPIAELFDFIAGTSTGGIIALGLTKPGGDGQPEYSAQYVADLYEREGPVVFSRDLWWRMLSLGNLIGPKYPSANLEQLLLDHFGEIKLSQSLCELLVPAYDIRGKRPYFFKSTKARNQPDDDFYLHQVAMATAVAPTYFAPYVINESVYVDGGVFANNPSLAALVEVMRMYPKRQDIIFVSLGTGEMTDSINYEKALGWGRFGWARPILDIVFDGASDSVDHQVRKLIPKYFRFQGRLSRCSDRLDDVSRANILALKRLAGEIVDVNRQEIHELCQTLGEVGK